MPERRDIVFVLMTAAAVAALIGIAVAIGWLCIKII
jgi:hypothetical protein